MNDVERQDAWNKVLEPLNKKLVFWLLYGIYGLALNAELN